MRKKVLGAAASLLASLPGSGFALGLGDIQLKSSLNAPLDAEIELVGATAEELAGLKVQLASRDTFSRYGIDYPAFLSGITVRTTRGSGGRTLIQLRSNAPITEPFVTVLVEANYGRGRQVREYSVLLDPPVFTAPSTAPVAPVAAPSTGSAERSGQITRSAAPAAAVSERNVSAASQSGGDYRVKSGDTLSGIAISQFGTAERRQAMVAIFRGNPTAFDGNMNQLRSGSVLRLPDASTVASIPVTEATAEIRRQSAAWQGGASGDPQAASPANQLRLVPPQETKSTAAPTGASAGAAVSQAAQGAQQLQQRLSELETQLADARRELEKRQAELAKLQPTGAAPVPASDVPPAADSAAAPIPAPKPVSKPVASKPSPATSAAGGVASLLKSLWYLPAGLLALSGALFGLRSLRRRREESVDLSTALDVAVEDTSDPHAVTDVRPYHPASATNESVAKPDRSAQRDASFVVEENHAPVTSASETSSTRLPVLKPGADNSDPISEADFHMAYGLYDQAADLIRLSVQREPQRRDLKLKLLEILFVWGNKAEFVSLATELSQSRDQGAAGEWDKVLIMGRQLAPEVPLFSGAESKPASFSVDHNLEGGQNRVDLDLPVSPVRDAEPATLDFPLDAPLVEAAPVSHPAGSEPAPAAVADKTQELAAFDDMGLDIGTLDTALHPALGDTQLEKALGLSDSTAIMPGLDPAGTLSRPLPPALAGAPMSQADDALSIGATSEWQLLDPNSETLGMGDATPLGGDDRATVSVADADSTLMMEAPSLSEIGTKLDLARAYIDMGDPEGARSILNEVLAEGNDSQKQEAQRLLDAIPG